MGCLSPGFWKPEQRRAARSQSCPQGTSAGVQSIALSWVWLRPVNCSLRPPMEHAFSLAVTILLGAASIAFPQAEPERDPGRAATINLQEAIISTKQGQRAAARLKAQWAPELAVLEKAQAEIKSRHGWWPFRRTMSRKQKAIEARKIDEKARALQRHREDDRAAVEIEQKRIFNELGRRMHTLLENYARDHGYSAIFEAGNPQSPVLVTQNDITGEVVNLYDRLYPVEP